MYEVKDSVVFFVPNTIMSIKLRGRYCYKTIVRPVILYESEYWAVNIYTQFMLCKSLHDKCLTNTYLFINKCLNFKCNNKYQIQIKLLVYYKID